MKEQFTKFFQLVKADVAQRLIFGVAAMEIPDKAGEIFDYVSSKPLVKAWSDELFTSSGGKSLGNVREQHSSSAVGKITKLEFNDAEKAIEVVVKVVDDAAWAKVEEGVYSGFSFGGRYEKRWIDGNLKRYTARPFELTITDNPCIPGANFEVVKSDGSTMRKFFSLTKTRAGEEKLEKSMWDVSRLADMLQSLCYMQECLRDEAIYEGDNSPIPEKLKGWIETGVEILGELLSEEGKELIEAISKSAKGDHMDAKDKELLTGLVARLEALEKKLTPPPAEEKLESLGKTADGNEIFKNQKGELSIKKVETPAESATSELAKQVGELKEAFGIFIKGFGEALEAKNDLPGLAKSATSAAKSDNDPANKGNDDKPRELVTSSGTKFDVTEFKKTILSKPQPVPAGAMR